VSEAAKPSPVSTATTFSPSSELELIEQLKRQLAGPLFTAVSCRLESYQNRLQYAELKIRVLEERLRLVRIAKYGPGSEKFSDAQLGLLELEPGVSSAEVQAESERPAVQPSTKTKRKHPGRQELPVNLPRGTDSHLYARAMLLPRLWKRDGRDRPRRELPTGCGTGEVFRAGQQTRKARLQVMRGTWCGLGATVTTDHREVPGQ